MPIQEHIVLSTLAGDVFAILKSTNYLDGIYAYIHSTGNIFRVKVNIREETISRMTRDGIRDIPVGRLHPILDNSRVEHENHNHIRDQIIRSDWHKKVKFRDGKHSSTTMSEFQLR